MKSSLRNVFCGRLAGGLGNQMFQYAMVRSLSHDHGADLLLDTSFLESSFPGVTSRTYALDAFQVAGRIATREEIGLLLPSGLRGAGRMVADRVLPLHRRRFVHEPSHRFHPEVLRLDPPAYLAGYWQSPEYFSRNADLIRADFALIQPLSAAAQRYAEIIPGENSVSMHVRRGDYLLNEQNISFHGVAEPSYYRMAFERIARDAGEVKLFVFSDEPAWVRTNLDVGTGMEVVELAGIRSEHEEIHLMAACRHHIISNSTFGWWGAWLGSNSRKIVVAPRRWFADPARETDVIPPDWIRI